MVGIKLVRTKNNGRVSDLACRVFTQVIQVSTLSVSSVPWEWLHGSLMLREADLDLLKQVA